MKARGYSYLKKITAVDYSDHLEVLYILYDIQDKQNEVVKVRLDAADPKVESVMKLYKAADWYEREMSEMFGIKIMGRKTKRLLLEKWNGTDPPLRKSFVWGNPNYKRQS
jgi:NADH-quinone oxidoreductase subunit C